MLLLAGPIGGLLSRYKIRHFFRGHPCLDYLPLLLPTAQLWAF